MTTIKQQLAEAQAEIKRLKKIARCQREPDKSTLGGIIQAAREKLGMSLREAATKAGMSPGLLSRIERNIFAANPTLTNIIRLEEVTGMPLSGLFLAWEKTKPLRL